MAEREPLTDAELEEIRQRHGEDLSALEERPPRSHRTILATEVMSDRAALLAEVDRLRPRTRHPGESTDAEQADWLLREADGQRKEIERLRSFVQEVADGEFVVHAEGADICGLCGFSVREGRPLRHAPDCPKPRARSVVSPEEPPMNEAEDAR